MNRIKYIAFLFFIALLMTLNSCKKPYLPPVIASNANYLVVEGVINTGQDSTIIRLSRTVKLSDSVGSNPELHASVSVESDANTTYPLAETGKGYYSAPGLNLSASAKYRVKIVTADNKAYQSDLVPVKNSPPIDSVHYSIKGTGLEIDADSHDPANNTKYYRWDYADTWIIHSAFSTVSIFSHVPKDTVLLRPLDNQIYTCWQSSHSNNIILGSSAKLSADFIHDNEISFISSTSEKLASRYSILVKQYALTKEAFSYWQQLKKNTEQLGSIFDAQPSEIAGNVHSITDPAEPVIGYISAGSYAKARIFIDNADLPAWQASTPNANCLVDTLWFSHPKTGVNDVKVYLYSGQQLPLYPIISDPYFRKIIGYAASSPECVDCTLRGTNKRPLFWIDR